ncbi:hypothetical protein RJ640_029785 [Escallonia rubra]|uniref:Serine-threonine/tyrosine-protein kinase catalytic domain-containing protein n=1 Tax=Escallonia rubra TaxID=112253 RepID=A0AA88QMR7_9ASTE|nr:hypothetical protein RJ640_029785 [Escallonia rubra]
MTRTGSSATLRERLEDSENIRPNQTPTHHRCRKHKTTPEHTVLQIRLNLSKLSVGAFFDKLSHPNLLRHFGYCLEEEKHFLVHEFMENGRLDTYLSDGNYAGDGTAGRSFCNVGKGPGCITYLLSKNKKESESLVVVAKIFHVTCAVLFWDENVHTCTRLYFV